MQSQPQLGRLRLLLISLATSSPPSVLCLMVSIYPIFLLPLRRFPGSFPSMLVSTRLSGLLLQWPYTVSFLLLTKHNRSSYSSTPSLTLTQMFFVLCPAYDGHSAQYAHLECVHAGARYVRVRACINNVMPCMSYST